MMIKLTTFFFFLFPILFSYSSQAGDCHMGNWHGDMPGMGHGHQFYNCPHRVDTDKSFQEMPGAELFQTKGCTACHTIGGGDKTGPDLAGLFKRRSESWVREFIQNPTGKIQTDAKANALQGKYGTEMPQISLSPQELDQIVEFLKKATQ